MYRPFRFLVDVDEVLCNFVQGGLGPLFTQEFGVNWRDYLPKKRWDVLSVLPEGPLDEYVGKPGFVRSLPVYPEAQTSIARLRHYCEIVAVTTPSRTPYWAYEREQWLKEHFDIDRSHILQGAPKHMVSGDFFLDDNPENVLQWSQENEGTAMLWTTPYNKDIPGYGRFRVHHWNEVIGKVRASSLAFERLLD